MLPGASPSQHRGSLAGNHPYFIPYFRNKKIKILHIFVLIYIITKKAILELFSLTHPYQGLSFDLREHDSLSKVLCSGTTRHTLAVRSVQLLQH